MDKDVLLPVTHKLKIYPAYFNAVDTGRKPFDVRVNDRDYKVGDLILFQEYSPTLKTYSGRETLKEITYILNGGNWGIDDDCCVLGLTRTPQERCELVALDDKLVFEEASCVLRKYFNDDSSLAKGALIAEHICKRFGQNLQPLNEKSVMSILVKNDWGWIFHPTQIETIAKAICQKFGTAPAQKTLSLEEIETVMNDNLKRALEGLSGYNWGLTPKAITILASAIKAKMEGTA